MLNERLRAILDEIPQYGIRFMSEELVEKLDAIFSKQQPVKHLSVSVHYPWDVFYLPFLIAKMDALEGVFIVTLDMAKRTSAETYASLFAAIHKKETLRSASFYFSCDQTSDTLSQLVGSEREPGCLSQLVSSSSHINHMMLSAPFNETQVETLAFALRKNLHLSDFCLFCCTTRGVMDEKLERRTSEIYEEQKIRTDAFLASSKRMSLFWDTRQSQIVKEYLARRKTAQEIATEHHRSSIGGPLLKP